MALLLDIFDGARQNLSRQWHEQPTPAQTARRIRRFFETLTRDYDKRQSLSADNKRSLLLVGELLEESSSLLNVHSHISHTRPNNEQPNSAPRAKLATIIKRLIHPVLVTLLSIWLVAIGKFTMLIPLLILAATILPLRTLLRPSEWKSYLLSEQTDSNDDNDTTPEPIQIDVNTLLTRMRAIIGKAEALLTDTDREPHRSHVVPANPLHGATDVLSLFQDLLEAWHFQDAEYALKITRGVRPIMTRHGIDIESFQEGTNDSHFEFEFDNSSESDNRVTTRFALITDDRRLLLSGTVLESRQADK